METTHTHKTSQQRKILLAGIVTLILWCLLSPTLTTALYGIGGLLSEKLIGSPLVDSRLTVGPAGAQLQSVAMGPRVVTLSPVDVRQTDTTYATLRGEVLDLNIDPSVTVWFEWGYHPNFLNRIVGTQTLTSPGIFSTTITGQTPGVIYYRVVAEGGDGTNPGSYHAFIQVAATYWSTAMTVAAAFGVAVIVGLFVLVAGNLSIPVILMALVLGVIGTIGLTMLTSLLMQLR